MKPILLGLLVTSSLAVTAFLSPKLTGAALAVAAPNTGSVSSGVFHASVDRAAAVRFEFTLAQHVLLKK